MKLSVTLITFCVLTLLVASCQSHHTPYLDFVESVADAEPEEDIPTLDEQFLKISNQISGFSGLYRDSDGGLVAKVAPSAEQPSPDKVTAEEARDAILGVMGEAVFTGGPNETQGEIQEPELSPDSLELRLEATTYTFEQLYTWYLQIRMLGLENVMIYDVDEFNNDVYLGVETEAEAAEVSGRIAELSLPSAAVRVRTVGPVDDLVLRGEELREYEAQRQAHAEDWTLEPAATQDVDGYNNPLVGGVELYGSESWKLYIRVHGKNK